MPPIPNQNVSVSQRIMLRSRALRIARGWSQDELVERLSQCGLTIPQSKVSKMELGVQRVITVDELVALARAFDVTLDELVKGECNTCKGTPPPGFQCRSCGAERDTGPETDPLVERFGDHSGGGSNCDLDRSRKIRIT